jgi:predicted metalloprotease with PDZ domain
LILLLAAFLVCAQDTTPQLFYSVTVPNDRSAYLVELQIDRPPRQSPLVIPSWAPGAYRLMDSWQNIRDFAVVTGAGDPLPVQQDSPISWIIDTRGSQRITVRYAAGLPDSDAWRRPNNRWFLRGTSGVIDGPRTFMYLDGWKQVPARVTFQLPAGWHLATGMPPTSKDSTIFAAANYDVLIDSPVLLGRFLTYSFTAVGTPHRAVVDLGGGRAYAPTVFVDMLRRISTTGISIFGSAPYTDYTYIFVGGAAAGSSISTRRRSASRPERSPGIRAAPER